MHYAGIIAMCKLSHGSKSIWRSQLTELKEASQRIIRDTLTTCDGSKDEKWGETDASGRDTGPFSSLRCFFNYEMSII